MISVVVPVWNEVRLLPGFLDRMRPRVRRVGGELIIVDGGSDDGTADLEADCPDTIWLRGERGRGRQMNLGARAARGTLLVFLPADTRPAEGALRHLERIDRRGSPAAGGFHQRFDRDRPLLRVVSRLHNLRARLTGVFYGDQLPFVRRELFERLCGFREDLDMEDVEFATRLRRRVRARMQPFEVVTSSRRFDEAGDVRAVIDAARLLAGWTFARRVGRSRTFFDPVR